MSHVITKAIAEDVAVKATKKLQDQIEAANKEISQFAKQKLIETVPAGVMDLFAIHPDYINSDSRIYLKGAGIGGNYGDKIYFEGQVPQEKDYINLSTADATTYVKMKNKRDKLKEKRDITREQIEALLLSLRSYKNIREQFPEIIPHLPEIKGNAALIHIPADMRKMVAEIAE